MLTKLPATVVCLLSIWVTALAQTEKVIKIDGDSDFHLGTNTEIAGHLLKPGMYRVKLLSINGSEIVTFERVAMRRFAKGMWPNVREELFRIEVDAIEADPPRHTALRVAKRREDQIALEMVFKNVAKRFVFR